jgi:hypothetical protein
MTNRIVLTLGFVLIAGCADFRQQMTDMTQLQSALATQFHHPMSVRIMNGAHLTIVMPADTGDKISEADGKAFALTVARFAYTHFGHPTTLADVSVVVVDAHQYGIVTTSRTNTVGTWSASELAAMK